MVSCSKEAGTSAQHTSMLDPTSATIQWLEEMCWLLENQARLRWPQEANRRGTSSVETAPNGHTIVSTLNSMRQTGSHWLNTRSGEQTKRKAEGRRLPRPQRCTDEVTGLWWELHHHLDRGPGSQQRAVSKHSFITVQFSQHQHFTGSYFNCRLSWRHPALVTDC